MMLGSIYNTSWCATNERFIGMASAANISLNYAEEYNIQFNGSKSCLLLFKARQYKAFSESLRVN